jgi:hypothetical protein
MYIYIYKLHILGQVTTFELIFTSKIIAITVHASWDCCEVMRQCKLNPLHSASSIVISQAEK